MKIISAVLAAFICITITAEAQNDSSRVTFTVTAPGIAGDTSVYIAGSNVKLGGWDPSAVKLIKQNDSTWSISFSFAPGEQLEYKFTKGSWNKEALTDNGSVPGNHVFKVGGDTVLHYRISKWKDTEGSRLFKGQITGKVEYFRNMTGEGIKPRDVIVWLPPSYYNDTTERYPVLYMHDGQNLFDPKTASFGVDWQLDESADSLIKAGAIKGIIIVGIYNTIDRITEYLDTKLGHDYMNFVVDKLKPFIDKHFRTLPDRANTATGGSSAGGLISFMLLWEHPEIFSKAACLSPAFHIDRINYIPKVIDYAGPKKKIKVYIDVGTSGLDARLKPGTEEMVKALESKGYAAGKDIDFYVANGADHNEAAWAKRNWRYLEFMFGRDR